VAGVSSGGSAPISQATPGVTNTAGSSASRSRLASQAKTMEDPSRGPRSKDKLVSQKNPSEPQATGKKAGEKDKKAGDKKKKDESSSKKKKKGLRKLIPW